MHSRLTREKIVRSARKLVVKIGTAVLSDKHGQLDMRIVGALCRQVVGLMDAGRQVVIVSSGAVGAGMGVLGLADRPKSLPMLQASAAVGQGMLMKVFERNLARHGRHAAQILLTRSDFEDRRRYVNIRNTLNALQQVGAVPIINENDTVAVDELRFGENDLIAALMANLTQSDLLVVLSTVDGLIKAGRVLDFVETIDDSVLALAGKNTNAVGMGGMQAKLQAIYLATEAGIDVVLANGRRREILDHIVLAGTRCGTVFAGRPTRLGGRKGWIALAASGVLDVSGSFDRQAVVAVVDRAGDELARGQVNYSSTDLARIKGQRSQEIAAILGHKIADEVIHRNNLIVTAG